MSSYAEIVKEYGHKCAMEYKVDYSMCEPCIDPNHQAGRKCSCEEMPHFVSEECAKCVAIKNDIHYLKSEIVRSAMNYGIEVSRTLETRPDFAKDIDNLTARIKMMERVLIIQKIETEVTNKVESQDDNMSVVSFEYVPPEDAMINDSTDESGEDAVESSQSDEDECVFESSARDLNRDFDDDVESNMKDADRQPSDYSDAMIIEE